MTANVERWDGNVGAGQNMSGVTYKRETLPATHWFSLDVYPFHFTKYSIFRVLKFRRRAKTNSTSYSDFLLDILGQNLGIRTENGWSIYYLRENNLEDLFKNSNNNKRILRASHHTMIHACAEKKIQRADFIRMCPDGRLVQVQLR